MENKAFMLQLIVVTAALATLTHLISSMTLPEMVVFLLSLIALAIYLARNGATDLS
jgi:hypothetical protein